MRSERARRRCGRCCATASSVGESSRGESASSGFRVGKESTSSSRSTGAWTDAAGHGRRPSLRAPVGRIHRPDAAPRRRLGGRSSSVLAGARPSPSSCWACRSSWRTCRRRSCPTRCGSTSSGSSTSSAASRRRRPSSTSRWPARSRSSSGRTSCVAVSRTRRAWTRRGHRCRRRRVARHGDLLRVVGRAALADVPALATPAALRRRGSDLRQGRRLLRLLAPVPARGVGIAALAHRGRGRRRGARVSRRGRAQTQAARTRATTPRCTSAALAAAFLLVVAWRLRLEQYALELGQPSPADSDSFAGAGYVDVHVRSPGLAALRILAIVLALACVIAPHLASRGYRRRARLLIGVPAAGLLVVDGVRRLLAAGARAALRRQRRIRSSANSPS